MPEPPEPIVWYGELTTRGRLARRGLLFLLPAVAWLTAFLLLPGLALVAVSLAERGDYGEVSWVLSLDNYRRAFGHGLFGWSPVYLIILGRSALVAFLTTAVSVALSYPLAFFVAGRPPRTRYLWLTLVIIPFWTNVVIRTYGWMLLLGPELPFARTAAALRLIDPGAALYPGSAAVYVGMVSTFLPFVALPLFSSVERLDWALVEAARDLYASGPRVFAHAILPQTLPGLTVGAILTFVPAMGMFVVPDLLGGARHLLVGNLIQQQVGTSRDWPFAAALSLLMMLLTLLALRAYTRRGTAVELV